MTVSSSPTVLRDLSYRTDTGPAGLLDLHLPQAQRWQRAPIILNIHGGGWKQGTKTQALAAWLTGHGYAVACNTYRLSEQARWPAQLDDCKATVRWLRAHADQYGLDAARLGVFGRSAGGHLALMLALTTGQPEHEGAGPHFEQSSAVHAVCSLCGPADLWQYADAATAQRWPDMAGFTAAVLGGAVAERLDLARQASPLTHVRRNAGALPPIFFAHGDADEIVPLSDSQRLHVALEAAGADVTLSILPGAPHLLEGPELNQQVLAFFERTLR